MCMFLSVTCFASNLREEKTKNRSRLKPDFALNERFSILGSERQNG